MKTILIMVLLIATVLISGCSEKIVENSIFPIDKNNQLSRFNPNGINITTLIDVKMSYTDMINNGTIICKCTKTYYNISHGDVFINQYTHWVECNPDYIWDMKREDKMYNETVYPYLIYDCPEGVLMHQDE